MRPFGMGAPPSPEGVTPDYKSQPWILFDTVASADFRLGSGTAIGSTIPAITSAGEMIFFNGPGRNNATMPWYTNLDVSGQLAYGLEVWQIYVLIAFPAMPPNQNIGYDLANNAGVPGTVKLAEAILHYSVLDLQLGQETQTQWPLSRFGAGGGLNVGNGLVTTIAQNGIPEGANVLKLPEPIQMPRTQNLSVKIKIATEARTIIGTAAAPGVGTPLSPYLYGTADGDPPTVSSLAQPPFAVQLGLVGKRIKDTQYGQLAQR